MEKRPKKEIYSLTLQKSLRNKAIKKFKSKFFPNNRILKVLLMGSSVKGTFGKYFPPGFRGSLYSDFDFIVLVKDEYKIPRWLRRESSAKPFPIKRLNLAYRNKKFIDNKYDVEIFFIREKDFKKKSIQKLGEKVGIPLTSTTKNKYCLIC